MSLDLRPIALRDARRFIAANHRHSEPPRGWLFGVALYAEGELRAVGVAGRPIARHAQDGRTVEITRVCTLGDRNAASRIYGALCRAAQALGYHRAITYTLGSEAGSSVKAAGFTADRTQASHEGWSRDARVRALDMPRLFDEVKMPNEAKVRWVRDL